jgi:hypothetical protein
VKDHEGYGEANDGVCDRDADRDHGRARDDAKADESVHSGVVPVREEGGTIQTFPSACANLRCDLVPYEADHSRRREPLQV